jgi:NADP-dependent 3-hydroxy acid dehydrogenase YdfG
MVRTLNGKVVALPLAVSPLGAAVAKLVAAERGELVLGASTPAQLRTINAAMAGVHAAYSVQVDLDRPKSVDEFFKIAIGQYGHVDVIVVETMKTSQRSVAAEKAIGLGARRLLNCLDAALRYAEGDLHIVNVAPAAGRYAIPVATAFLGAKLATTKSAVTPCLRMSVVSPFDGDGHDEGTLARTVLHVMREPRTPDITEMVLRRRIPHRPRDQKSLPTRSKILVPM